MFLFWFRILCFLFFFSRTCQKPIFRRQRSFSFTFLARFSNISVIISFIYMSSWQQHIEFRVYLHSYVRLFGWWIGYDYEITFWYAIAHKRAHTQIFTYYFKNCRHFKMARFDCFQDNILYFNAIRVRQKKTIGKQIKNSQREKRKEWKRQPTTSNEHKDNTSI